MRLCDFSLVDNLKSERTVEDLISELKKQGFKIVLTSGTFDLLHIGHAQYLQKAKDFGDVLVVGLDSDEKVKVRKGPNRPIVSEDERARILSFVKPVDFVVFKDVSDKPLSLIKAVRPDILVVSETTKHDERKIGEMLEFCGNVEILEAQSTTSTTARVRRLFVDGAKKLAEKITNFVEQELHKL